LTTARKFYVWLSAKMVFKTIVKWIAEYTKTIQPKFSSHFYFQLLIKNVSFR
jgi:hypothetical protein